MNITEFYPLLGTMISSVIFYLIIQWAFNKKIKEQPTFLFFKQLTNVILIIVLVIAVISSSPLSIGLKGQILSLIGIVLSGAIALSSTTILGNALAGIMLRTTRNFKVGDFIDVNDYFGKVSGRNLLNIEIQTFDRGLITLPNIYLVTNPLKVLPESGVLISVDVSLGYDVPRNQIEDALIKAAQRCGLENAFVQVKALLDHSVQYSLLALLTDLERFFTVKSLLHASAIDALHEVHIEIVSPKFVNSRAIDKQPILAKQSSLDIQETESFEEIVFEKANLAEELDDLKLQRTQLDEQIKELPKESKDLVVLNKKLQSILRKISYMEGKLNEDQAQK